MGAIWSLFSPCVSAGASAFKAVPLMRSPQWSHWWEAQCERGWPQPTSPSQNWASTALGFPFIQRCPLWTKTWKDTENRQREWESGGKGRRFPAETCCAIFDRKVQWNDASLCPNIVFTPSINIEPYVSIIHSASFLPPPSVPKNQKKLLWSTLGPASARELSSSSSHPWIKPQI